MLLFFPTLFAVPVECHTAKSASLSDTFANNQSISGLIIFHYTKWFLLIQSALFSHQDHNTLTNKPFVNLENRTPPAFLSLH